MRTLFMAGALLFAGCAAADPVKEAATGTPAYDAALAEELGADDYGMHPYVMVILMTGPEDANITDEARRAELFAGHFSTMGELAEAGLLVMAGPFMGDAAGRRGVFIYDVDTVEEAEALAATDPTVAAGIFTAEPIPFYGSAALKALNDIHARVQKTKVE